MPTFSAFGAPVPQSVENIPTDALPLEAALETTFVLGGAGPQMPNPVSQNMGPVTLGNSRDITLQLHNVGQLSLTDLTLAFSSTQEIDFQISPATVASLPAGEKIDVTLTFTPTAIGQRGVFLEISGTTGEENTLLDTIGVSGTGLDNSSDPGFWPPVAPIITAEGESISLEQPVISANPITSYAWSKNGLPIATTEALTLTELQPSDAGSYTLTVTDDAGHSATSHAIPVVITQPLPEKIWYRPGDSVTLSAKAFYPPGMDLYFDWKRYSAGETIGVNPELSLTPAQLLEVSQVTCTLTAYPTSHGDNSYPIVYERGWTELTPLANVTTQVPEAGYQHHLGETVSVQLTTVNEQPVDRFTITGLPPGLTASASGLITGVPKKISARDRSTGQPIPYQVRITAHNAGGTGPTVTVPWTILPLIPIGTYEALIDDSAGLDEGLKLGSHLKFTINSAGSLSGQIINRGKTWRFAKPVITESTESGFIFECIISRGRSFAPLKLTVNTTGGEPYTLTLENTEVSASGSGDLRRQLTAAEAEEVYEGSLYTWEIQPRIPSIQTPMGSGYMTSSVSRTGSVKWKGKLADGTAITGSSQLSRLPDEIPTAIAIHKPLYKATASLHGWAFFHQTVSDAEPASVSGYLHWFKQPNAKDRNHRDGIPLHEVELSGGLYTPPARGELLFDLTANTAGDTTPNLTFNASAFSIPNEFFTQDLLLLPGNKFKLPKVSAETPLKSLTFNTKTGTFKGSFTLLHESDAKLNRTATFEGILPNEISDQAQGFFLLPDLPEEEGETLRNTLIRSGYLKIYPILE